MKFKHFIFLCILLSFVLISLAAVQENTKKDEDNGDTSKDNNQVGDAKYWCGFRGCCGFRGPFGGCSRCCSDAEVTERSKQENKVKDKEREIGGGRGGGGHGGGGAHVGDVHGEGGGSGGDVSEWVSGGGGGDDGHGGDASRKQNESKP